MLHTTLWNINARKEAINAKLRGSIDTYLLVKVLWECQ